MPMTPLLIDFVDFPGLTPHDNPFLNLLGRRYELVPSDSPDYLMFTHSGQRHKLYSCTKIFYTPERYAPRWKDCDYAITCVQHDDPRTFHLPYYSLWRSAQPLIRPGGLDWRAELKAKTGFCSFLCSYADRSVAGRTRFFQKLDARKRVDSAGRALNNTGWSVPWGYEPKLEFLRRYKFHIAFENRDLPGLTSEKLPDAFAARTVPIFWGDITVKDQFNREAFIDRRDFDSDDACVAHILQVDADDSLYLRYLSAPPFYGNRPNQEWDHERLLDFFDLIFNRPPDPVARRRWFYGLTKWRVVKRIKTPEEKGAQTARQRFEERTKASSSGPALPPKSESAAKEPSRRRP